MQLELTLKTFFKYVDGSDFDVRVLYKADEKHRNSYDILIHEYEDYVEFIKEKDFKQDLLKTIDGYDKILWVVDDNIWVAPFNLQQASDILDYYPKNIGVSFRLGINTKYCYSMAQFQGFPNFSQRYSGKYQDFLGYQWPIAVGDFQYALELSSSLYRVNNLMDILNNSVYSNPNDLEWQLYINLAKFAYTLSNLICYEQSVAFCNPVNKVQTVNNNRSGNNFYYNPEELLMKFEQGYRINSKSFDGFVSSSCHQEVRFDFVRKEDV